MFFLLHLLQNLVNVFQFFIDLFPEPFYVGSFPIKIAAILTSQESLELDIGIVSKVQGETYTVLAQESPGNALQDGQTFPFGATYCAITLALRSVLAIPRMGESAYKGHPCYDIFKLEAYIGAPVWVDGQLFGTVNFTSPKPYHRDFDEVDKDFVELLGRWAGSTIERAQALKRLAESEMHMKAIVETEPECVKLLAPDGKLLQMNRAGLEMLEVDEEAQVIGQDILEVVGPEYRRDFLKMDKSVAQGGTGKLEFEIVGLKGTRRWMDTHAAVRGPVVKRWQPPSMLETPTLMDIPSG